MRALFDWNVLKPLNLGRLINLARVNISFHASGLRKKSRVWGYPYILTIEPTNRCNLRCPQCVTGAGTMRRSSCDLHLELYRQILNEIGSGLWYLVLYNQGEPFLHPDLITMIHHAKQQNIYVITSTNGHFLSDSHVCEDVVRSGLDKIIISLDGADEETYSNYRYGGDFNRVVAGIKLLIETKKRLRKKNPIVVVQFLIMRHNEHQMEDVKKLAKSLGADKQVFKTIQIIDANTSEKYTPTSKRLSRYETVDGDLTLKYLPNRCRRLWTSTTILSNGDVVPCCFDKEGSYRFGTITTEQTLKVIWRSSDYERFRTRNLHDRREIDICRNCSQGQKVYI